MINSTSSDGRGPHSGASFLPSRATSDSDWLETLETAPEFWMVAALGWCNLG